MFEGHDQAIQELLAAHRLITPAALLAMSAAPRTAGLSLARAVLEAGLVDRLALLQAVAAHLGYDCRPQLPPELPPNVVALVDASLVRTHGIVPLAGDDRAITLAVVDPFNPGLAGDLSFALGRDVRIVVADPEQVRRLIGRHYGDAAASGADAMDDVALEATAAAGVAEPADPDLTPGADRISIVQFVNLTLAQAVRDRASDIHFEPFEREFRIRCRIDGALRDLAPPPQSLALPIISRLKVLANVNIAERRVPQDGRIRLAFEGRAVDLRLSTLPTQFGESVVLRVLDQSSGRLALAELGLPPAVRSGVEAVIRRPHGMFIVTGPTGSGKTTTLYSCLQELNTPDAKLLTVEDPVEYEIDGIMQVPVNLAAGLTFARALRTFLRQDPDIVMVGEIRDAETAQIAIQAALTGHLVLTTLHTNDAVSAVTRLMDMGVEPFLLASTVHAVLAQRLLRRTCTGCRVACVPDGAVLAQLGLAAERMAPAGNSFWRGAGCPACNGSGYRGRIGLFEFLPMTDALRELIAQGASLVDLRRQAGVDGLVTLRESAFAALLAGDATVEEVMKYI